MANGFKPGELDQFQQYVVDKLERIPCLKDGYDLPQRVRDLETDQKWYKRVWTVVTGAVGAILAITFEWFLHRRS